MKSGFFFLTNFVFGLFALLSGCESDANFGLQISKDSDVVSVQVLRSYWAGQDYCTDAKYLQTVHGTIVLDTVTVCMRKQRRGEELKEGDSMIFVAKDKKIKSPSRFPAYQVEGNEKADFLRVNNGKIKLRHEETTWEIKYEDYLQGFQELSPPPAD